MHSFGVGYSEDYRSPESHRHKFFRHMFNLKKLMWLAWSVQLISVLCLLTLQILYFRKSIFLQSIPISVIFFLACALIRNKQYYIWPAITLSCFHVILALYMGIIFVFYFTFKPLYIIMVLNWAFDTQYTGKTPSYYIHSTVIFSGIMAFGLYNYWQLRLCIKYSRKLDEEAVDKSKKVTPLTFVLNSEDSRRSCPEFARQSIS